FRQQRLSLYIAPHEILKDYYQILIGNYSNDGLFFIGNVRTIIPPYQQRSALSTALTQNEGNSYDYINDCCKHQSQ
ncbi:MULTISPECIES: hypothetical protein, partial [unclassified Vibrio]|uniref:hypothetical protein n=1 Tax=unclassified Vibrio TaxID=2614977 RepID=UPI00354C5ADA